MTKVAVAAQLPASNDLHFGGVVGGGGVSKISTTTLKRKTPSELRGELLKLKNPVEFADESPSIPNFTRNADGAVSGVSKSDSSKIPQFIRMDEHFPVTKISRLLPRKGTFKDDLPSKCVNNMKHSSFPMEQDKKQGQNLCVDTAASEGGKHSSNQNNNSTGKCIHNTFRSVKELSVGSEKLNGSSFVDMVKALRGLVSCESRSASAPLSESIDGTGNIVPHSFCSEIHIPGPKIPLDLTLKTSMRLQSSTPVIWFHRLINVTSKSKDLFSTVGYQIPGVACSSEPAFTSQSGSWIYPQSILPQAAISALASAPGDFISKRQQAWEDSFRSLYYMLRKKICELFYVCSPQFVVMFTAYDGANKIRSSCYAYVSQSTSNLRSLLKEHDVSFSMPLCSSKLEEVTAEDIVELSHIEKHNLGQTRAMSLIGVDNTPQSLLMFSGNKNVHALYDFLLNYRSFLTSLTGGDVPVLYSPVPFENAALSTPEVRCKQVRKVDYLSSRLKDSNTDSEPKISGGGICYSVEIKDAYLPPWVISGICNAMRSNGGDFEASFSTESTTNGLNVGLDVIIKDHQSSHPAAADEQMLESDNPFSIPNTTVSFQRRLAFLKGLKYGDGSYTAFLSPIE